MVEWAAADGRICGFGDDGWVQIEVEDWQFGGDPPSLPNPVDTTVVGTTTALAVPTEATVVTSADDRRLQAGTISAASHRLRIDDRPETHFAFDGPATVESSADGFEIRFSSPTALAVGFREEPTPRPTVRVPSTAAGLAAAVTAAGGTHRTEGPARSHPGFRPRTPYVTFGGPSIPDHLSDRSPETTMTVPSSARAVLLAAPLAYYLGAGVDVEAGPPRIDSPELTYTFDSRSGFAESVSKWLRELCTLDSRLREVPGESGEMSLDGYDTETLRTAPPAARLAAIIETPPSPLPEWPLTTYVDNDIENGRYLPYVLDRLSLVEPAEYSALDPKALLKRSLDEFYRGETPNVEAVDPSLNDSRSHAWLGDGTPVDAYTLLGSAVPRRSVGTHPRVDVVCNDPEMASEQEVASVYRRRLAAHGVSVSVHEQLRTDELAAVFEQSTNLVHFIGHVDVDGLVCPDGSLAAADLEECAATAFVLNACGSYYEGYDLVRQGATVGAVTLTAVLDEQAVRLGTALAALLAEGFSFDRALSLARGEIIVGRDYVVVGDGTYCLRSPTGRAGVLEVTADGELFTVRYDATDPLSAGRRYVDPFDGEEHLFGTVTKATLDRDGLLELLTQHSAPVRYDGNLRWTGELAEQLTTASRYG
jgi:hypothetical protein